MWTISLSGHVYNYIAKYLVYTDHCNAQKNFISEPAKIKSYCPY